MLLGLGLRHALSVLQGHMAQAQAPLLEEASVWRVKRGHSSQAWAWLPLPTVLCAQLADIPPTLGLRYALAAALGHMARLSAQQRVRRAARHAQWGHFSRA